MRVQDPQHYAEVLLSLVRPGEGYTEDRIKKMIAAGGETDIQFPSYIPVNLTYQTAFVDDDGKLQFRDDIYGRDRALIALLKSDDRKVLDVAVEHPVDASHREALAMPDQPSLFGGHSIVRRPEFLSRRRRRRRQQFFSRLFGGFCLRRLPPAPHKPATHARKLSRARDTIER